MTEQQAIEKKVYQTKFGKTGNCLHACLATLLGLSIADLPDVDTYDWQIRLDLLQNYLIEHHELYILTSTTTEEISKLTYGSIIIVCGETSRGLMHAVLYQDGKLYHDPHPDNIGIDKIQECDSLVKYFKESL